MTDTDIALAPHVAAFFYALTSDWSGLTANEWASCEEYRAIKWRRSSDDTTVVAPFRTTREEALLDALHDYAPHARAVYEIEDSAGNRTEITEDEYELAVETYHRAIENRDAVGVWG